MNRFVWLPPVQRCRRAIAAAMINCSTTTWSSATRIIDFVSELIPCVHELSVLSPGFRACVRSYIENAFNSNGQCFYTCLSPGCRYEYPTNLIGQLLAPTLFSRLLIKIQQEELRRANIPNFEQCKYCTFGTSKNGGHEIRVRTFGVADRSYRESR